MKITSKNLIKIAIGVLCSSVLLAPASPAGATISTPPPCAAMTLAADGYQESILNSAPDPTVDDQLDDLTPDVLRQQAPAPRGDTVRRTALRSGETILIGDLSLVSDAPCGLQLNVFTVPATGPSTVSEIGKARYERVDDLAQLQLTTPAGATTTSTAVAACDGCAAGELISVAFAAAFCRTAVTGIFCALVGFFTGNVGGAVCTAENCDRKGQPGMIAGISSCSFGTCDLAALIYPGKGRSISSVCSSMTWVYPPGFAATHKNAGLAVSHTDGACASNGGAPVQNGNFRVQWTHAGSDISWTNCSTTANPSITTTFSDGNFLSTGSIGPHGKPALNNCPGYRATV